MPAGREAVQGKVQAGEPRTRTHGGEAVSVPFPRMRKSIRPIRKSQDTQENTHR